jgi:serine/threonine protein kinase
MNDLYKRVVKGVFDEPPSIYSRDLKRLIRSMITVQPDMRPSANQILASREITKAIKYFDL